MNLVFSNSWPKTRSLAFGERVGSYDGTIGDTAIVCSPWDGSNGNLSRWPGSAPIFDSEVAGCLSSGWLGGDMFTYRTYQQPWTVPEEHTFGGYRCHEYSADSCFSPCAAIPEPIFADFRNQATLSSALSPSWRPFGALSSKWSELERFSSSILDGNRRFALLNTANFVVLNDGGSAIQRELVQARRLSVEVRNYALGRFQSSAPASDDRWTQKYYQLRMRMQGAGLTLNDRWVRFTEELLAHDAIFAIQLLAVGAERFTLAHKTALKKTLSRFSAAKSIFRRLMGRIFQVGNLISSQRRWYLHHGAHPSGTSRFAGGGFLRVCLQSA